MKSGTLKKGSRITVTIIDITFGGEGISRHDGLVVFVPDSVRGDVLHVEVVSVKKSHARAIIKNIQTPSPYRITPRCELSETCGGCQWQHVSYEEQLRAKQSIVADSIERIAKQNISIQDIIPNPNSFHYRCKVQYPVQSGPEDIGISIGYYRKGTHRIVDLDHCPIQAEAMDPITKFIRQRLKPSGLPAYDERSGAGIIRHIVYRYSHSKGDILCVFVVNLKKVPSELAVMAEDLMREFPAVKGVLASHNTEKTNVIMGKSLSLIRGAYFITETIGKWSFRISAESFFQVNPPVAKKILDEALSIIERATESPSILDVYSGVGTFTLYLSDYASELLSVEESPSSIRDLKENIEQAGLKSKVSHIQGDAARVLDGLVKEKRVFDVTILDPPRKGCGESLLKAVSTLTRRHIIYVSCDPTTMSRDIAILAALGFSLQSVRPFDMFSHTYHIECLAHLSRLAP